MRSGSSTRAWIVLDHAAILLQAMLTHDSDDRSKLPMGLREVAQALASIEAACGASAVACADGGAGAARAVQALLV